MYKCFAALLSLLASGSTVVKLNRLNYVEWSEHIQFTLGIMGIDEAIMKVEPPAITETSSEDDNALYESWEWSNRLSLNLMRISMAENINPSMPKTENARDFMLKVKEHS